jgi:four helix bundle protein
MCDEQGMTQINSFRDLEVWLISIDLVDEVIKAGRAMPRVEFDLRRQMTRAAISIPSNVAEGWKRKQKRGAYQNHVSIAMGSEAELETQMEVCFRNQFLMRDDWKKTAMLMMRVRLMLDRLHDSLD